MFYSTLLASIGAETCIVFQGIIMKLTVFHVKNILIDGKNLSFF